jgi:hypothetical protein
MKYLRRSSGGDLDLVGKLKGYEVDAQTAPRTDTNSPIDFTL